MLSIVMNAGTQTEKIVKWSLGTELNLQSTDLMDVENVEADGRELDFLKYICPSLKIGKDNSKSFSGSDAIEAAAILLAKV